MTKTALKKKLKIFASFREFSKQLHDGPSDNPFGNNTTSRNDAHNDNGGIGVGGFADDAWQEVTEENTGAIYYWNQITNETSWDKPETFQPLDIASSLSDAEKRSYVEQLTSMGYGENIVNTVLLDCNSSSSIDTILNHLEQLQGQLDTSASSTAFLKGNKFIEQFVSEFKTRIAKVDNAETLETLMGKMSMAQNMIETFDSENDSKGVHELLEWCHGIKRLEKEVNEVYNENIPFHPDDRRCQPGYKTELFEMYADLEEKRRGIDNDSVIGIISDKEIARYAELDSIAAYNTEDEQAMHFCLKRR